MALNKMLIPIAAIVTVAIILLAGVYAFTRPEQDTLYQVSAFNAFSAGNFERDITFAELAKNGDFGIGTLNGLDGEMFALNGKFYQIPTNGPPRVISSSEKTPYATVTFFNNDQTIQVVNISSYSQLTAEINSTLPNHDAIFAIKVVGFFDFAKTRSVPIQTKPYPTLTEAVKNQTVFNLTGVEGTAVGFIFPETMDGVDATGYHLHFLTDDLSGGGHLLECTIKNAIVEIDQTANYHLVLA